MSGQENIRNIRVGVRFLVFQRDKGTCQYCGAQAPDVKLTCDHIIPWSAGGRSTFDNLVTACVPCNSGKGRKQPRHIPLLAALPPWPVKPVKERKDFLRTMVSMPMSLAKRVDDYWHEQRLLSRNEAIRALLEIALEATEKKKPRQK